MNSDKEFFVEVPFKQNTEASDVGRAQWRVKEDTSDVLWSTWLWAGHFP